MVSNLNNQALNPNLANYDPAVLDEIRKNTDNYNEIQKQASQELNNYPSYNNIADETENDTFINSTNNNLELQNQPSEEFYIDYNQLSSKSKKQDSQKTVINLTLGAILLSGLTLFSLGKIRSKWLSDIDINATPGKDVSFKDKFKFRIAKAGDKINEIFSSSKKNVSKANVSVQDNHRITENLSDNLNLHQNSLSYTFVENLDQDVRTIGKEDYDNLLLTLDSKALKHLSSKNIKFIAKDSDELPDLFKFWENGDYIIYAEVNPSGHNIEISKFKENFNIAKSDNYKASIEINGEEYIGKYIKKDGKDRFFIKIGGSDDLKRLAQRQDYKNLKSNAQDAKTILKGLENFHNLDHKNIQIQRIVEKEPGKYMVTYTHTNGVANAIVLRKQDLNTGKFYSQVKSVKVDNLDYPVSNLEIPFFQKAGKYTPKNLSEDDFVSKYDNDIIFNGKHYIKIYKGDGIEPNPQGFKINQTQNHAVSNLGAVSNGSKIRKDAKAHYFLGEDDKYHLYVSYDDLKPQAKFNRFSSQFLASNDAQKVNLVDQFLSTNKLYDKQGNFNKAIGCSEEEFKKDYLIPYLARTVKEKNMLKYSLKFKNKDFYFDKYSNAVFYKIDGKQEVKIANVNFMKVLPKEAKDSNFEDKIKLVFKSCIREKSPNGITYAKS